MKQIANRVASRSWLFAHHLAVKACCLATILPISTATANQAPTVAIGAAVPNFPPAIRLTNPRTKAAIYLNSTVRIVADAQDQDGAVARVEFLDKGEAIGTMTTPPFTLSLTNLELGNHILEARATDNQGATATSAEVTLSIIPCPQHVALSIVTVGSQSLVLSWPTTASEYVLESLGALDGGESWQAVPERPSVVQAELRQVVTFKKRAQFFRLRTAPPPLPTGDFRIEEYTLVSTAIVNPSQQEDTFRANVSNWSGHDAIVAASLNSTDADLSVVQGGLGFGLVPAGATMESTNTFTVRHDPSKPFDPTTFIWTIAASSLPPTTHALIDEALDNGLINAETALVYKVYDDFNDSRLPGAYQGRDEGLPHGSALREAEQLFDALSPSAQRLLDPFRLLPTDPGSWVEVQAAGGALPSLAASQRAALTEVQWATVTTKNGKAKVWWMTSLRPGDGARAQAFADEIDVRLWPKLTELLGEPLSIPGRVGSVRLDIYMTNKRRPECLPLVKHDAKGKPICTGDPMPAVILLGPSDNNSDLAHEMTHAILYGFKLNSCVDPGYLWMHEATATWAEHFIYPLLNFEHGGPNQLRGAYSYLQNPTSPLDFKNDDHEYGAYLWFFFLTDGASSDKVSNPPFVRQIWDAATNRNSLTAINSVVPGGLFKKKWPEFVLYNWNRVAAGGLPYRQYHDWDRLNHHAKEHEVEVKLNGKTSGIEKMDHYVPGVAAEYFHYKFDSDMNIRHIVFKNPWFSRGVQIEAKVQAILKIRDYDWKPAEDWTTFLSKELCRDRPAEDIQELVIVISNSSFMAGSALGPPAQPPELRVFSSMVFSNGFDGAMPAELEPRIATLERVQGYAGLGPPGNQFGGSFLRSPTANLVVLKLTDLPPHDTIGVSMLFAAIDSLDGSGTFPSGDFFDVFLDGINVFHESFANALESQVQSYVPPPGGVLARRRDLGFGGPGGYFTDSAYDFGVDARFKGLSHTADTATFVFRLAGEGAQTLKDESWAIDNLAVFVDCKK